MRFLKNGQLKIAQKTIKNASIRSVKTVSYYKRSLKTLFRKGLKPKQPLENQGVVASSGNWTRTSDLRVMSPTSYLLLYPALNTLLNT